MLTAMLRVMDNLNGELVYEMNFFYEIIKEEGEIEDGQGLMVDGEKGIKYFIKENNFVYSRKRRITFRLFTMFCQPG
jgi:hypothetical protein